MVTFFLACWKVPRFSVKLILNLWVCNIEILKSSLLHELPHVASLSHDIPFWGVDPSKWLPFRSTWRYAVQNKAAEEVHLQKDMSSWHSWRWAFLLGVVTMTYHGWWWDPAHSCFNWLNSGLRVPGFTRDACTLLLGDAVGCSDMGSL